MVPTTRTYRARAGATAPTLVWLHGGAFCFGSLDMPESEAVAAGLADRGVNVVTVDYRRVALPGFADALLLVGADPARFPAPVDDVVAAVEGIDWPAGKLYLGGASAGACLAEMAAERVIGSMLSGIVNVYGFFHRGVPSAEQWAGLPEIRRHGCRQEPTPRGHRRITHRRPFLAAMARNAEGTLLSKRSTASVFPGDRPGDYSQEGGLSRLFINAERDVLRYSADVYAQALRERGADVCTATVQGADHAFLNDLDHPAFAGTLDTMTDWLRRAAQGCDVLDVTAQ